MGPAQMVWRMILSTLVDQEKELEAWTNYVVDKAVLNPMDADGGLYNLYLNSHLRNVVSLLQEENDMFGNSPG